MRTLGLLIPARARAPYSPKELVPKVVPGLTVRFNPSRTDPRQPRLDRSIGHRPARAMPTGQDDRARSEALAGYAILDTPPEPAFDDIALLASQVCGTPMALVSLVDEDRQWFKARIGFPACETDLARSVCVHALAEPGLTVIPDLGGDVRTRSNPLVIDSGGLRFYAGTPLVTKTGVAIGTLCVLDTLPRPGGLTPDQSSALAMLGRQVMTQLELRRSVADLAQSTATLRESEARLRTVFQTIYQLQGLLSPDGNVLDVNDTALKAVGRRLEEVRGKPFWDGPWFAATPGLPDRLRSWVADAASGATVREEVEARLPGGIRTFELAFLPVPGPDGATALVVVEAVDLTERRAAEGQLRQSQKMEAVGQLTGGIAHDFINMLAVIVGSLNLLERRLAKGETEVGRYVEAALDGAGRAAALTHRLLAFSRQQPLSPAALDANRMVSGMHDLLVRTLGEDIRVETVLSAGLWKARADPSQLENVILNLCVNARDAMPDGGRLTIETNNAHIDDDYGGANDVAVGQYVLVAVSDTVTGMPADVVAKAFDPFFTTKGPGKGTGLGLSQVFGFVRQSDGHVKIYSEAGHGTTLKVYLPRFHGSEEVPAELPQRAGRGSRGTETILVVEDDERMRACSVESLRELGYDVSHAPSGADALRMFEAGRTFDLLFTDIVMPGMTGRQLAETALARVPGMRVLYTTGYTRNAVVHNGVIDPGTHLLSKPYGIDQLAEKVRALLDR
ncbi:ATP-binding protein [Methylobacterium sp. WL12]|uniref:ATP-binding protein n=1 Tax=Methylobacterium sp. WL12 TaxID=2603890 RepID=UPI00164F18E6